MYPIGGLKAVAQRIRGGDLPDLTGGVSRGVPRVASWRESEGLTVGSGAIGPSSRERQGAQFEQGAIHLVLPGPALGKVQGYTAGLAGDPPSQGEEATAQGLGGDHLLA